MGELPQAGLNFRHKGVRLSQHVPHHVSAGRVAPGAQLALAKQLDVGAAGGNEVRSKRVCNADADIINVGRVCHAVDLDIISHGLLVEQQRHPRGEFISTRTGGGGGTL